MNLEDKLSCGGGGGLGTEALHLRNAIGAAALTSVALPLVLAGADIGLAEELESALLGDVA